MPTFLDSLWMFYIYTLQYKHSCNEQIKVRNAAKEYEDVEKHYMVHDTSCLHLSSIRLILCGAEIYGVGLSSNHMTNAHLQIEDILTRRIIIQPEKEYMQVLSLFRSELLELSKPIYALCDTRDFHAATTEINLRNNLAMSSIPRDATSYIKIMLLESKALPVFM